MPNVVYRKLRPILYHPVPGNVEEIGRFPVVGHAMGMSSFIHILYINP